MTKVQEKSKKTLIRLLEPCLVDINHIKRDCSLVSLTDIKKVYVAFGLKCIGKNKEMLIGELRGFLYTDIEEKIFKSLE